LYDLKGRLVTTLVDEHLSAGRYEIPWHGKDSAGRNTPSGVYFARLETRERMIISRMTLVR
jgi:flagellar hook assembly protein FlgD